MVVSEEVGIRGTIATVWSVITDVDSWPEIIRGVRQVEVTTRPASGLMGLSWKETRLLFDKPETVEKVVIASVAQETLTTRSEQDGFVFETTFQLSDQGNEVVLTSIHRTEPQNLAARLRSLPLLFFRGFLRKAILEDLEDLKQAVESAPRRA